MNIIATDFIQKKKRLNFKVTVSALFALAGNNWVKYLLNKQSMLHIALVSHSCTLYVGH